MIPLIPTMKKQQEKMNRYDTARLIDFCLSQKIDISPADRQDWKMFCCALKVLGYDEQTFVDLCPCPPNDSRRAWRDERNPHRYSTEDTARAKIAALGKAAGIDLKQFSLSHNRPTALPTAQTPRETKSQPHTFRGCNYLSDQALTKSETLKCQTSLYAFMLKIFGRDDTEQVFAAYRVGGSRITAANGHKANCFPYINTEGKAVDCKIFHINPVTGSRKTAEPLRRWYAQGQQQTLQSTWAIAELNRQRKRDNLPELNRAAWCNFGDHLLPSRPAANVCIVESEKTAMICAIAYPDDVWVATGSQANLTAARCEPYRGRTIVLYPDRDAQADWESRAQVLADLGHIVRVDTTTATTEGDEHDDIADLILRDNGAGTDQLPDTAPTTEPTEAVAVWTQMIVNNPDLARWQQALQLTPVATEPNPMFNPPNNSQNGTTRLQNLQVYG